MKRVENVASYFVIDTASARFILPVINSTVLIKLPETLSISYYKNDEFMGKSKLLNFN
jgi:hypothetical protein